LVPHHYDRDDPVIPRGAVEDEKFTLVEDALLAELAQSHLQGKREYDRSVRARIRGLEDLVALPLPRKVTRARNTVRLHAALLDWQEIVLDDLFPQRAELPDLEDEDILELVSEQPRLRLLDAS